MHHPGHAESRYFEAQRDNPAVDGEIDADQTISPFERILRKIERATEAAADERNRQRAVRDSIPNRFGHHEDAPMFSSERMWFQAGDCMKSAKFCKAMGWEYLTRVESAQNYRKLARRPTGAMYDVRGGSGPEGAFISFKLGLGGA